MDELRCSGSIAGRSAVCVRFTADLINFPWKIVENVQNCKEPIRQG